MEPPACSQGHTAHVLLVHTAVHMQVLMLWDKLLSMLCAAHPPMMLPPESKPTEHPTLACAVPKIVQLPRCQHPAPNPRIQHRSDLWRLSCPACRVAGGIRAIHRE